ncbi:MAG: hypothetical protein ACI9OJ_001003 [Myxococcota bacterium]|jgi:hypothetical protein
MKATARLALSCLFLVACGTDSDSDSSVGSADTGSTPDIQLVEDTQVSDCPTDSDCDDGDACTESDRCDASGECVGTEMTCDDGLDCTDDLCVAGSCQNATLPGFCADDNECLAEGESPAAEPCRLCAGGAVNAVANGVPCDDGSACTLEDACASGSCVSQKVLDCPQDDDLCTTNACNPQAGCTIENNSTPCDDGDQCTTSDVCQGGLCGASGNVADCDDEDSCTLDGCDPKSGCTHDPTGVCADSDPCTLDVCELGACTNSPFSGPCDDGEPCTSGEDCVGGVCSGGGPTDCDDSNVCTNDLCIEGDGCVHYFADGNCSDGFSCTSNDLCVAGTCIGDKMFCADCPLPVTDHALKVIDLTVPADGNAGSALDIDGDPETCSPPGKCGGGVDNALGVLAPLLNGPLATSIAAGSVMYVTDLSAATLDGQPFPLSVLDTNLTEAAEAAMCDFQAETCAYVASQFSYDAGCSAYFGLPDAVIEGGTLKGGGIGYTMTIGLAISNSVFIPLTLVNAQIKGTVVLSEDGTRVVQATGIIGGAAPKKQLLATMASISQDELPIDKETVLNLINDAVVNDIDLDGDGTKDAASIGIRFLTVGATLEAGP